MEDQTNPHASSSTLPSLFRGLGELRINSLSAEESASSSSEAVFLSDGADCVVFTANDLFQSAFPAMSEMRRDGKLCDVTVKVGGTHFKVRAHKVVLAATIPYFRAMFEHEGFNEHEQDVITIGEDSSADNGASLNPAFRCLDANSMEALINFAYSGKVTISSSNVQSLMMGASFLQLSVVRDACADFLMTRLLPHNVLGVMNFADTLGCISLVKACQKFIKKFFSHVVQSDEFLMLPLSQVKDLISDDELEVASEELVFESVMHWVNFDKSTRKEQLPQLLYCVRMPLLKPQYLSDKVAPEELIRNSHKCRDLLDEAKDFHLMPERRPLLVSFRTKPRRCKETVGVIYAVGGQTKSGNSLSTVEVYDPVIGKWQDAEAMSMLRSRVGVSVLKNRLYAIGGYNGTDRLNTVEEFDAESKRWSRVASMNCNRSAVGAVTVGQNIYVCGGFDGISSLDTVEKYNTEKDTWSYVDNMSKNRSAAGVIHLDGKVYVLGGHNGLSIFETVEYFDATLEQCRWKDGRPMLSKRCRLGVATLNGKIYACGGYDGSSFLKSVEMYDPVSNKWTFVASMNVPRSRVALVANMGNLYAIGGYDGMKNLSTVEMYSPEKDEWTYAPSMESHEGGVGVGVIPKRELKE